MALVLDRQIASLPKVTGGEPYLSRGANEVLQKAVEYSKGLGDEYVSLEAMLLAILNVKGNASTILKDAGMNRNQFDLYRPLCQVAVYRLRRDATASVVVADCFCLRSGTVACRWRNAERFHFCFLYRRMIVRWYITFFNCNCAGRTGW